jgi:hypothetical protein
VYVCIDFNKAYDSVRREVFLRDEVNEDKKFMSNEICVITIYLLTCYKQISKKEWFD